MRDQPNGTKEDKKEFVFSGLCIRDTHRLIQALVASLSGASGLHWVLRGLQAMGSGVGRNRPARVPSLVPSVSDGSVDLHVSQSTACEKKPYSVAVSALAVVRQCKIKLIKPPTQENITGN